MNQGVSWLAEPIAAICDPRFATVMLKAVNRLVDVDHCALIRLAGKTISQVFTNDSLEEHPELSRAAIAYIDRFFRYDPNLRDVGEAARLRGKVLVRSVRPADIRQRAYRKLYEDSGIAHRISLLTGTQGPALVALNFYRVRASGEFSDAELALIKSVALPLVTIARRHVELLVQTASSTDAWRQRLKVVRHDLSFRELEVAAGMLAGKTLREIAASLGVAHSTAITYRERAYRRLGVQNLKALRQLFSAD
ncbi:MAG TPA: helix-turn-helix transcriptional regulator [Steroidobacteraceae bacterium]|nr:helix-turn-helix transcriptional regulator [Steroidobacteraceae bacterium]